MATKWNDSEKPRRGTGTFVLFFLAVNLLLLSVAGAAVVAELGRPWESSVFAHRRAQSTIGYLLDNTLQVAALSGELPTATAEQRAADLESLRIHCDTLEAEGGNLFYFAFDRRSGVPITNTDCQTAEDFAARYDPHGGKEAELLLEIREGRLSGSYGGEKRVLGELLLTAQNITGITRVDELAELLQSVAAGQALPQPLPTPAPAPDGSVDAAPVDADAAISYQTAVALIALPKHMTSLATGQLWRIYCIWYYSRPAMLIVGVLAAVSLLMLLVVLLRRRSMAAFHRRVAETLSHIWVELRLAALIPLAAGIVVSIEMIDYGDIFGLVLLPLCGWMLYFWLCDLFCSGRRFFTSSLCGTLWRLLRRALAGEWLSTQLQRRLRRRFLLLVGLEMLFVLFGLLMPFIFEGHPFGWMLLFACVWLGIAAALLYLLQFDRTLAGWETIVRHIERMRGGDYSGSLQLQPEDDLYYLANNINDIQSGIKSAVEEQVKSERMKAELITNVSHDLKTPLTSIINYVDLLAHEDLQPEFANDYVAILQKKSAGLKVLVQDLFEISKVNSGSIELQLQQLDIGDLLEQTLAELDDRLCEAGLELRFVRPEQKLVVMGDGKKLHRVFENLAGNAAKYALAGTRFWVNLRRENGMAVVELKNIAGYEMSFTGSDVLARFVRGDSSRTTEGHGLGLSIAESFLAAMGGSLSVIVDGDLFKAVATLPLVEIHGPAPEAAAAFGMPPVDPLSAKEPPAAAEQQEEEKNEG